MSKTQPRKLTPYGIQFNTTRNPKKQENRTYNRRITSTEINPNSADA